MTKVDFVFDSPRPQDAKPLHKVFSREIAETSRLDIAVGYVSEISLKYLYELATEMPQLQINLTCGMHGSEGMTAGQLRSAVELNAKIGSENRGGVFVIPRMAYHGKIYLFDKVSTTSGYVGSANLSSILAHHTTAFEAGIFFPDSPPEIMEHLERDIYPHVVPIDETTISIISDERSPMYNVEEARPLSTSRTVDIITSPAQYTFNIPLKANPSSSLNAHLGGDGKRIQKAGGSLARNWFEGELIVNKADRAGDGYPNKGEVFTVVTDDGWTFNCKTSGQDGKNLRSAGKLSTFGTWMKSRLMEAGVLEFGEVANEQHIEAFGRSHLTMKYHPAFDVWSFDLSVDQNSNEGTPKL